MGSSLGRGARRILSSLGGIPLSDQGVWSPAQGSVWTSGVWLVVEIVGLGQTWSRCPRRGAERRDPAEIQGTFHYTGREDPGDLGARLPGNRQMGRQMSGDH